MPSFILAVLLGASLTAGGREAVRVARLSAGLGPAVGLVVAACVAAVLSTALAAWIGSALAVRLSNDARLIASAAVLLCLSGHVLFLRAPPQPKEPTRSFAAIVAVLTVAQSYDPARLALMALLIGAMPVVPLAWGVGLGSLVVVLAACFCGSRWKEILPLPVLRAAIGFAAAAAAIAVFFDVLTIF